MLSNTYSGAILVAEGYRGNSLDLCREKGNFSFSSRENRMPSYTPPKWKVLIPPVESCWMKQFLYTHLGLHQGLGGVKSSSIFERFPYDRLQYELPIHWRKGSILVCI